MENQRNLMQEVIRIAGQEELGYNLLGYYLRPSDYKYESLGARYRYCSILLSIPHLPDYAEDILKFDNSKQRLEKTKQKLEEIRRYLGENPIMLDGKNSPADSLGYIAYAPFRDSSRYNYEIKKKHGIESWYEVPENVKKEFITFEDAISRNFDKYSKIEKMLYELTNTNEDKLIENLHNVPLNRLTIERLVGGTFLSSLKRLTCPCAIDEFQKTMKEEIVEAKYDEDINTLKLTKDGVKKIIKHTKKMGRVEKDDKNIYLTTKGLAFMAEYFQYVGSGG